MKLSSVMALKSELQEDPVVPRAIARSLGLRGNAARSHALATRLDRVHARSIGSTGMAMGVSKGRRKGDYRLGVRIQARGARAAALAHEVLRRTSGEADVRFVPKVRARVFPPRAWFRRLHRPLEPGLSIGQGRGIAGTLGAIVKDSDGTYVLSNNHVLADVNAAHPGAPVSQPGDLDRRATSKTLIGVLDRFVPISFARSNVVDCAIAEILKDVRLRLGRHRGLRRRMKAVKPVTIDDLDRPVLKAGRTTGVTRGHITQVDVDRLKVDMGDEGDPREALFSNQIEIIGDDGRAFSDDGDSGSLILDGSGHPRALLFCGGPDEEDNDLTWANRIEVVLAKLGVVMA